MAGVVKRILVADRRRTVPPGGFSWIDRRLVRDGFLAGLSGPESLLYFFLITVSDQDGLSFHGDRKTAALLKMSVEGLERARRGLELKDLVRYRAPLYQVLSLPAVPAAMALRDYVVEREVACPPNPPPAPATGTPMRLGTYLRGITRRPD